LINGAGLGKEFPLITVRKDRRVVDTGKVVTSAGVSAGIDGALHVVERLLGRPKATSTARYMEYNWQPGGGEKNCWSGCRALKGRRKHPVKKKR
jgi:transcriptional regulator GlxA family with amidase domain